VGHLGFVEIAGDERPGGTDAAEQGDLGELTALMAVLSKPYTPQPGCERFAARRPEWARHKAGCSMLSCSS